MHSARQRLRDNPRRRDPRLVPDTALLSDDRHKVDRRTFALTAVTLTVVTVGVNMPPPLFPRYVDAYGLSPLTVTSVFATYTLCIVPALLLFGPVSDTIGRKPVLVAALVIALAATLVLAAARNEWWLYAGRALQGLAVGATQGPAAAALADHHPRGDAARAAMVGTLATCVGTAVGPMTAGVLAQYLPAPLQLSFLVEVAVLAVVLGALLAFFSSDDSHRRRIRISRPSVPPGIRPAFIRASASAVLAWVVTGLFLALAPSLLQTTLDTDNSVVSGGIVALLLVSSALAQLAARTRDPVDLQISGLVLLIAGLGVLLGAASAGSVALCGVSAAVAGIGQGLAFSGSAREISAAAPSERRGAVMAVFFVAIYLGVTVAVVGVGVISTNLGLLPAVQIFSAVVALACAATILTTALASRRGRTSGRRQ